MDENIPLPQAAKTSGKRHKGFCSFFKRMKKKRRKRDISTMKQGKGGSWCTGTYFPKCTSHNRFWLAVFVLTRTYKPKICSHIPKLVERRSRQNQLKRRKSSYGKEEHWREEGSHKETSYRSANDVFPAWSGVIFLAEALCCWGNSTEHQCTAHPTSNWHTVITVIQTLITYLSEPCTSHVQGVVWMSSSASLHLKVHSFTTEDNHSR